MKKIKINKKITLITVLFLIFFIFIPSVVLGQLIIPGGDLDNTPESEPIDFVGDDKPVYFIDQSSESGNAVNKSSESGAPGKNPSETGDTGGGAIFDNPIPKINSLAGLVHALLDAIINIGWIFVVLALIYTGFKFVTASGNPTELANAKKALLYTIIGGVILLGSMSISQVICKTAQKFDTDLICEII